MLDNTQAIEAWNTVLFDKFVRFRDTLVHGFTPHSDAALEAFAPPSGGRAIDVGCGFGDTTIELARRLGATGHAVGVDAAPRFVEGCAREAAERGVENVRFEARDVGGDPLGGPFDYAFSRFGTMFFASPVSAMRNLRRSLVKGGQLVMIVWRRKADNDCFYLAEQCVKAMVPPPPETDAVTCGPGPFSMSDANVVTDVLQAAGFTHVMLLRNDAPVRIGRDLDDAIEFALALGPAGEAMRLGGAAAERLLPAVKVALRETLAPLASERGVWGGSSTWIVSARA
jgi:SAM-dependent methyltransferase